MDKSTEELFLKDIMERISKKCEEESLEREQELCFTDIIGAKTVGELYDMDIPLVTLERLIVNIEPLLQISECGYIMNKLLPGDVRKCGHAQKRCFLF